MRIECSNCHKIYNIPDDRLQFNEKVSFPCPACKGIIEIDLRPETGKDSASSSQPPQSEEKPETTQQVGSEKELLSGEALKARILRNLKELPPMPQVMFKAREVMNNPSSNFKELSDILETDQAMATRVLRLANSAYYGLSGKVSSVQHASVLLGYRTLGEIVSMAGSSTLLGDSLEGYRLGSGDLWRHSLAVAFGSRIIAGKKTPDMENDAFAAGLIHDTGKLILNTHVFERNEMFEQVMSDGQHTFLNAEKQILGFDHPEIAFEMCKSWKIPGNLTKAIRYHHRPSNSHENELTYIVHVADSLALMSGIGTGFDNMLYEMDDKAVEFLALEEEELNSIIDETVESVEKITENMS